MPVLDVAPCLQGRRILVVEDDFFQAQDAEESLQAAGAIVVGPVPSIRDAAFLVAIAGKLDGAVLDVNLGGQMVYPLADQLMAQGTPIVFATGYSEHDIPARFRAVPCCEKPVSMPCLIEALSQAITAPPRLDGSQPASLHAPDGSLIGWTLFAAYMDEAGQG